MIIHTAGRFTISYTTAWIIGIVLAVVAVVVALDAYRQWRQGHPKAG